MTDPTGRWLNATQWQCPKCAWVNDSDRERCQKCNASVRPSEQEPVRRPDPLDLVGFDETRVGDGSPVVRAAKSVHALTRVTRDKATALIRESLRTALKKRGESGDRAWQAFDEMPESERRAALESVMDDLEEGGVALFRIDGDEPK